MRDKRSKARSVGLFLVLGATGCLWPTETVHVANFTIGPDTVVTHLVHPKTSFDAYATDDRNHAVAITWTSSNPEIATVSALGKSCSINCIGPASSAYYGEWGVIEAHRDGVATITVAAGDRSAKLTVVVRLTPVGARIAPDSARLAVGDRLPLAGGGVDSAGEFFSGQQFAWRSSDSNVATVDDSGLVRALRIGVTTISVTGAGYSAAASIVVPATPIAFTSINPAGGRTCGLATDGTTYCWGSGNPVPAAVFPSVTFTSLSTADYRACGVANDEGIYCWGTAPAPLVPEHRFRTVAVSNTGSDVTCALTTDSAAYCLGAGIGTMYPDSVAGGMHFRSIVVGTARACAIDSAGLGWCWGNNASGSLGSGGTADSPTPVAIAGSLHFLSLVAGYWNTCGVTVQHLAYCWGDNQSGQLGPLAGRSIGHSTPLAIPDLAAATIAFGSYAGDAHTCAATPEGETYCWGSNANGQLGDGTNNGPRSDPEPVAGGLRFVALAASNNDTCALSAAGGAYCWGANFHGQLGDGTRVDRWVPTHVIGSAW